MRYIGLYCRAIPQKTPSNEGINYLVQRLHGGDYSKHMPIIA